ncbi:VTC domain-containing protein [Polychytrium aggregatum]|uniref:VTC domain-containing protein n=1 Tax=Polychytrium aggregatum TaxID=110093 RepID=UPI0022FDCC99|nr:VTC domain-containing protein [Polychytrium aggregatum]KAI9208767.1 VTC domain-containing protein [Polychytrium aggregatum]
MRFGERLEDEIYPDWKFYSIEYNFLKSELEGRASVSPFTDDDEMHFVSLLDDELEKIQSFINLKRAEIIRRIQAAETATQSIVSQPRSEDDPAEVKILKRRLENISEEVTRLTSDLKELSYFIRLNYTGFMKILKKHDKLTGYKLTPEYIVRVRRSNFNVDKNNEEYSDFVIRLSTLFDTVRSLSGEPSSKDKSPGIDAGNIVRKTTKYWVHKDNVMAVKCLVLQHLPVLVFKKGEPSDPALSSIYFDNDELFLYNSRMIRDEKAQNLRFRWYGQRDKTDEVWVERKTHHEDWTGERSVKERFSMKEKDLNAYLRGEYDIRELTTKLRAEGKMSIKNIEKMERLADEVQELVLRKRLHPMIRTTYNRTAFQLPADARVRISLDTELTLIREDNYGRKRAGDNWRRMDAANDWPFPNVPDEDKILFPYAVLEIKLQTQHGQEAPQWAMELANSHLVEKVPKFSKFHHAISNFYTDRVDVVPFWFYQMDKDILKPRPAVGEPEIEDISSQLKLPSNIPGVKIDQLGKVYFSNERTFLRWLSLGIKMLSLSLLLMNFTTSPFPVYTGLAFAVIAMGIILVNLVIFHIRAIKLRQGRGDGPFIIKAEPVIICLVVVAALVANVLLSFRMKTHGPVDLTALIAPRALVAADFCVCFARPDDLLQAFQTYGKVKDVYIPKDYYNGKPRGFAYIQHRRQNGCSVCLARSFFLYVNDDDAQTAYDKIEYITINGRNLPVEWAQGCRKSTVEMKKSAKRTSSPDRYYRPNKRFANPVLQQPFPLPQPVSFSQPHSPSRSLEIKRSVSSATIPIERGPSIQVPHSLFISVAPPSFSLPLPIVTESLAQPGQEARPQCPSPNPVQISVPVAVSVSVAVSVKLGSEGSKVPTARPGQQNPISNSIAISIPLPISIALSFRCKLGLAIGCADAITQIAA